MIAGLYTAFRAHPVVATGFALALALTLFFAVRAAIFAIYWADPAHHDQPIAGWMTPRYVAHSWGLPPKELRAALGPAAPEPGDRRTLADLARDTGIPLATLIAELEAAAAAHRDRDR